MSKSEKTRISELINSYFKKGDHKSKQRFEEVLLTEDSTLIENSLLDFTFTEIDNIIHQEDITYVFKALRYIEILIDKYPDLNRQKIKKRLSKLKEKVDRLIEEKSKEIFSRRKVKKRIETFNQIIYGLETKLHEEKNKYFDFFNTVIFKIKNINYIEETIKIFPHMVNLKDVNGNSIYSIIIKKYIEEILETEDFETNENILYYNNILSLFNSKKEFLIDNNERRKCLQLIYNGLERLTKKDKKYKEKCKYLNLIKEVIQKEFYDRDVKNISLYYNIPIEFEQKIVEELNMYQTSYSKMLYNNRKIIDDSNYIITIDGNNAKEIDDALSIKKLKNGNYLLGVHIANVLGYLPYESQMVQEAINRSSSIYLFKNVLSNLENEYKSTIPIFPYQFSASDASLIENQPRLANSYFFEIDNTGNIINKCCEKTIMTNNKQCSYREANIILESGCVENTKLEKTLRELSIVANILENKYKPSKIYETIKKQSNNPADLILGGTRSEKIISNIMILLGNEVANWFKDPKRDYPCLLRVHEINNECNEQLKEVIKNFDIKADKEKFNYLFDSLLGIYPNGKYELEGRHDGLGLDYYGHFSSSLRRGADISNEYALDVCYFNNPTDRELDNLEKELIKNKNKINTQNNAINYFLDDIKLQKKITHNRK